MIFGLRPFRVMETVSKLQHLRSPAEEIYIIFYHCIVGNLLEICIA